VICRTESDVLKRKGGGRGEKGKERKGKLSVESESGGQVYIQQGKESE